MCATALSAALFGVAPFIATCILNTNLYLCTHVTFGISFAIVPCIIVASARSLWPLPSCAPCKNNQEARHSRCTQVPLPALFSWRPGDTSLQIQPPAPLCLESTWVPSRSQKARARAVGRSAAGRSGGRPVVFLFFVFLFMFRVFLLFCFCVFLSFVPFFVTNVTPVQTE